MILVTGGTGLVGSHLLYELAQTHTKIRAIYRNKARIETARHIFSYYTKNVDALFSKIEWLEADITDIPSLTRAFEGVSSVYHCAAFISFDPRDYYKLRRINIEGTSNVVNLCLAYGVEKLCYVSSVATIGSAGNNALIDEETHWNPEESHSVYAITKYGAEMEVWRGTQEGLNAVVVNPGVIMGPGFWRSGSGSLIKLVKKGMKRYTTGGVGCVDVFDVVKPMIQLMDSPIINQRYILVSENISYKDFFSQIAKEIGVTPPTRLAKPYMLAIAWRLDWLRATFFKKRRRLTKHVSRTVRTESNYSSEKIKNAISYNFKSMQASIKDTCKFFMNDQN